MSVNFYDNVLFSGLFPDPDGFCRDPVTEHFVKFDKDDRGLISQDRVFDLDPGKDIHKIQRFIPDKEVRVFTETAGQQHLFFCPSL